MRRPVLAAMSALSAAVVVLSVHASTLAGGPRLGAAGVAPAGVVGSASQPPATAGPARSTPARTPRPTTSRAARKPPVTATVNGAAMDTPYGPVQVQLTVRAGRIVRAAAIAYPNQGGRDQEINSRAVPLLDAEAVTAQSARIDAVSGATFTSGGYQQSLQSALDAAHAAGAL